MNTTNYIRIFRGDDSDALGYQTIVGTIKTDLDLTGCKAVFRFLGFYAEFNPIPEDKKLTIVVPAQASRGFPPGVGYASLKVIDAYGKIRTFTNRIPVIVDTMTPSCGCGEFEVFFSPFPELEPLKIFVGPNADDFDQYTGFISKIIDRASLVKYGLVMLADAMSEDGGDSGKAASPAAVKAAYDAIIATLTDNYYTSEQTEEAIDRVAAYYITYDAAGNPFPTYAALANAQTVYSGGAVRVPTRNDYCVVLSDETHQGAEYRYIYAVAEGQTTGSWQAQFPVEGVMTIDQTVTKDSANPVAGGGVWSAIWGALSALPTGFTSLYDWCVAQLAKYLPLTGGTMTGGLTVPNLTVGSGSAIGANSVAEGSVTTASGNSSHAEGSVTTASGNNSHAEGSATTASGNNSHAEGSVTTASGNYSHAEGWNTTASGRDSHVEGWNTKASGQDSHAEGGGTIAQNKAEHAQGRFNDSHKASDTIGDAGNTLSSIGFGTADSTRKNAVETMQDGKTFIYGLGGYDGTNPTSATDLAAAVNTKASRAPNPTAGNLAALDAQGNPTDAGWTASDLARYALVTKTIDNGAVTLDDRAINAVAVSSALASLTVNFPTATSGKARDFGLRLTVASGITTAPQIVLPQGVVCENADGEAPEIGADGAATILYFTETASGVFLVKGEVLTAIS